jgi:polyhydroxyalkanoate synthesis regulator phasin
MADRPDPEQPDKSVQQFRDALEKSVTVSRDRLQEVFDDAVTHGRMTRDDANELVSRLVAKGRQQTESLMRDLERLLEQTRDRIS